MLGLDDPKYQNISHKCVCEIEWNHMTRRHQHYISLTTGFKAFPKKQVTHVPPPFAQDCTGHERRRALASGRMLGGNLWLWGMWQHPSHIPFEDGSVGGNSFPFAKLNRIYDWQLPCPESYNHPMSCQVTKFWQIMLQDDFLRDGPTKTKMYADSWGIRKLISHALRNLRQDRSPRAPWLHVIISKKILDVRYFQNMNRCVGFWTSWTPLFGNAVVFAYLSHVESSTSTWSSFGPGISRLLSNRPLLVLLPLPTMMWYMEILRTD